MYRITYRHLNNLHYIANNLNIVYDINVKYKCEVKFHYDILLYKILIHYNYYIIKYVFLNAQWIHCFYVEMLFYKKLFESIVLFTPPHCALLELK